MNRRGFTLIELLVVIAIISVLVAMLLPAVQAAREAARRTACRNQVRQQVVATHLFADREGTLPAGAMLTDRRERDGAGWRVLTLPYLEETALFDEMGVEPDGQFVDKDFPTPSVFVCPSSPNPTAAAQGRCHYAGVSGSGRFGEDVWDLQDAAFLSGEVFIDGVFYPGSAVAFGQITDGLSQTFAIGERAYLADDAVTLWMVGAVWGGSSSKIKDILMKSTKNARFPINAAPETFGFYWGDSSRPSGSVATLKNNDLYFGSYHPGGAHFALADGSVQFLSDDIDFNLYQDMASRAGGEVGGEVQEAAPGP